MFKPSVFAALGFAVCLLASQSALSSLEFVPTEKIRQELARETAETYFEALIDGDVELLKEQLSPDYAAQRRPFMDAEGFEQSLRSVYEGASFQIQEVDFKTDGEALIVAIMQLSNGVRVEVGVQVTLEQGEDGFHYKVSGERTTSRL